MTKGPRHVLKRDTNTIQIWVSILIKDDDFIVHIQQTYDPTT
jgi:hypothetical protein